jgi:hypothetical protein
VLLELLQALYLVLQLLDSFHHLCGQRLKLVARVGCLRRRLLLQLRLALGALRLQLKRGGRGAAINCN